jgi:ATP-binding cassette subfamily C (CFTR/MRP) protein 1
VSTERASSTKDTSRILFAVVYRLLGWSFLAGVLALLAMTPLQVYRARVYGGMRKAKLKITDERVRLSTEVLAAIKVVKLYAWESAFKQKILAIRDRELAALRELGVLFTFMSIIFISSTLIVCLLTLSVYAKWGGDGFSEGELTAQKVFVSMTLFSMLRTPIGALSEATTETIAVLVGTRRIETFLLLEDLQESNVDRKADVSSDPEEPIVIIKEATFSWIQDEVMAQVESRNSEDESQPLLHNVPSHGEISNTKPALEDINISVKQGQLIAVVGRVASGKSSLISAIIGDMYKLRGSVSTAGR